MKPWTRDDTKDWISQVENRIEDFQYYLDQTNDWCEKNQISDSQHLLIFYVMTCVWVSWMRDESITEKELFEILGISIEPLAEEKMYEFNPSAAVCDHEDLMKFVYDHLPS